MISPNPPINSFCKDNKAIAVQFALIAQATFSFYSALIAGSR